MIHLNVEPGSPEHMKARLGIPTASNFTKIITEAKLEFSKQSTGYALQLIAEQILRAPMDGGASTGFLQRGNSMEREAVGFYELSQDVDTTPAGFCLTDDRRAGCSPDRFVGDDGLLEIKCPSAEQHLAYLLDEQGIGHRIQVQTQLWITGRSYNDTLSYHPVMPRALVRQHRNEEVIGKIAAGFERFMAHMDDLKKRLQKHGLFEEESFELFVMQGGAQ